MPRPLRRLTSLDILITLRCNASCRNCIEFCNMEEVTGLDYADADMTLGQIKHFVEQVEAHPRRDVWKHVSLSGGEPTLHPDLDVMVALILPLVDAGRIQHFRVYSNGLVEPPAFVRPFVVTYTMPADNPAVHRAVLLHPLDRGGTPGNYWDCRHYRKRTVVLSYQGYSLCCAGDAYLRLCGLEQALIQEMPTTVAAWDRDAINAVCAMCPFGSDKRPARERKVGRPVSACYVAEGEKNRSGPRIHVRFPDEEQCGCRQR